MISRAFKCVGFEKAGTRRQGYRDGVLKHTLPMRQVHDLPYEEIRKSGAYTYEQRFYLWRFER